MRRPGPAIALAVLSTSASARAVDPFEIQVYDGTVASPGEGTLQLHVNRFASSTRAPELQGQSHATLEPAFGVLPGWDVGGYLQSALLPDGTFSYAGTKLRSEITTTRGKLRLALNGEISLLPRRFDADRWAAELRPIVAYEDDVVLLAVNPIVSFSLRSSVVSDGPALEPAALVRGKIGGGVALGAEYYAALGPVRRVTPLAEQEHYVYVAGDVDLGRGCSLDAGVGHGFGEASDPFVVKTILGCTLFGGEP